MRQWRRKWCINRSQSDTKLPAHCLTIQNKKLYVKIKRLKRQKSLFFKKIVFDSFTSSQLNSFSLKQKFNTKIPVLSTNLKCLTPSQKVGFRVRVTETISWHCYLNCVVLSAWVGGVRGEVVVPLVNPKNRLEKKKKKWRCDEVWLPADLAMYSKF